MENNKQTAVNYLLSHIWTTDWVNYTREQKLAVIEQAKEMEKQRMIEFAKQFIDVVNIEDKDVEIIYEQTYGGGDQ